MLRSYFKWSLFISSYTPLFLILFVKNLTIPNKINLDYIKQLDSKTLVIFLSVLIIFIIVILSNLLLYFFFIKVKKISSQNISLDHIENKNTETLTYMGTYLIPFIGVEFKSIQDIISNIFLFSVIGLLYIKSNLILVNPLLSILGFNIYLCKSNDSSELILITKKLHIIPGIYSAKNITNNIYFL